MTITAHVTDEYNMRRPTIVVHDTETPKFEARLATVLVERWGMVAGADDGEDAAGRSKLRLLTPAEVVARACETAELMVAEIRKRDWFATLPGWEDAQAEAKQQRIKHDEEEAAARAERQARR